MVIEEGRPFLRGSLLIIYLMKSKEIGLDWFGSAAGILRGTDGLTVIVNTSLDSGSKLQAK